MVLDNSDLPLDHLLRGADGRGRIEFDGVLCRRRTDGIDRLIKQITLGRTDFSDCPALTTDIVAGCSIAVCIRHKLFDQLITVVKAIDSTRESAIALTRSALSVTFADADIELLQNVGDDCV